MLLRENETATQPAAEQHSSSTAAAADSSQQQQHRDTAAEQQHSSRADTATCQYYSSLAATPPSIFLIDIQLTINDKLTFAFPSFLGFLTFIVNCELNVDEEY